MARPEPALIEIVEGVPARYVGQITSTGYIKPNEVRINGTPLAVPLGSRITVHEIDVPTDQGDAVQVTLTLFARRVVIEAESTDTE